MEGTKFYIASRLDNAAEVRKLGKMLTKAGWTWTYDWTRHGSIRGDAKKLKEVAKLEALGVMEANMVIVLLPGGKGTHTELGMAIAAGKRIILNDPTGEAFSTGEATCAFYHYPSIMKTSLSVEELVYLLTAGRALDRMISRFLRGMEKVVDSLKLFARRCSDGGESDPQERISQGS